MNPVLCVVLSFIGLFTGLFCAYLFLELSDEDDYGLIKRCFFSALFLISVAIAALSLVVLIWALCQIGG